MSQQISNGRSDWFKVFIIALIFALLVRKFLFSPIIVDGPSMQPTLYDRDQMIVNKFIYHITKPERFDIVIFHASEQKDFIKRVIGLPGEHVMVEDNILYIDGKEVEQPFLEQHDDTPIIYPIITNDFTLEMLPGGYDEIPEGYVLVLGDNRSNSTDSRSLGLISIDQIVGKTSIIYWPLQRIHFLKD
ncbi:signal peptidase I [Pseudogracilibacillus auburnensis]|uniref:Signal peptidase I n=1 Tax=Pseudogracilibacillus auburnensis TaxID=1494959 RepID=A0A2V3W632_9BACI|nr:signal peptidase I [Pseudogracilibacillus auburnensis]MBO1003825.1 signal peptidase I [Pseudogracilibacillus auburnensis]PXW88588.1 signal peptidase I [Pseudogracilibacillus auburnensis]